MISHLEGPHVSIHSAADSPLYSAENYISVAFRSSRPNEAYLFMQDVCVAFDYVQGTIDDKHLDEPFFMGHLYPSLRYKIFDDDMVDGAFLSESEVFIFFRNYCVLINQANGSINKGPMFIADMFPFLKGTVFEKGIDAAFELTKEPKAYLFRGNQYAFISHETHSRLIRSGPITQGFPSLRGTPFESGIGAAFASHKDNEAYIFKEDSYALIKVPTTSSVPTASTADYMTADVNKILNNWPALSTFMPHDNGGF